mmetsp:Transcript_46953/g.114394  ORF Transcript_46953/g.114394 Transcript_46953/m.114394 type:complete len:282 (-) Transcript_46953:1426-2271(-)
MDNPVRHQPSDPERHLLVLVPRIRGKEVHEARMQPIRPQVFARLNNPWQGYVDGVLDERIDTSLLQGLSCLIDVSKVPQHTHVVQKHGCHLQMLVPVDVAPIRQSHEFAKGEAPGLARAFELHQFVAQTHQRRRQLLAIPVSVLSQLHNCVRQFLDALSIHDVHSHAFSLIHYRTRRHVFAIIFMQTLQNLAVVLNSSASCLADDRTLRCYFIFLGADINVRAHEEQGCPRNLVLQRIYPLVNHALQFYNLPLRQGPVDAPSHAPHKEVNRPSHQKELMGD